jgi:two-component system, LytTR family, response regulator
MLLKAIIVDDEQHCIDTLAAMLQKKFAESITLLGTYNNADDAKQAIENMAPDLVFLDVEMPRKTGVDMLCEIKHIDFEIIFTTAYEQYALRAIKFNALDYLLKPFGIEELQEAISKCIEKRKQVHNNGAEGLAVFLQNLKTALPENKRITISTGKGLQFIEIKTIVHIEALNNYSQFYFADKTKLLVSKTLKEFDDMLTGYNFFRVHNSHLINLAHLKSILIEDGDIAVMTNGSQVEISRRKKPELIEMLKHL